MPAIDFVCAIADGGSAVVVAFVVAFVVVAVTVVGVGVVVVIGSGGSVHLLSRENFQ